MLPNSGITIYKSPELLLQKLIQFDTTNPPGNETECIKYIENLLNNAGIETKILGKSPSRQNLVAKLKGTGDAPPFLMYGHVDVVTVEHQKWDYPPFESVIADGCVWGRGALDMKGAVTMMVSALIRAKAEGFVPKGDIIFAAVSDEEDCGEFGAKYLTEEHPELFKDVKYAIGEIGGFTLYMKNKKFYPIMIAEKQKCSLKVIVKGPSGHGSMPMKDGAMAKLGSILNKLNNSRLPVHVTPPVKQMIEALSENLSFPVNIVLKTLLNPGMTDSMLKLLGDKGKFFDPILHNTVNATIVRGGDKINVIPSEIILELDGRLLPGFKPEDIIKELKALLGQNIEFEVTDFSQGSEEVDMGIFNTLSGILKDFDKEAVPIPFVISAVTDARYFSRIGIQTYGFTPMKLPKELDFSLLLHGANERIPVEALRFGTDAIYELLKRYDRM